MNARVKTPVMLMLLVQTYSDHTNVPVMQVTPVTERAVKTSTSVILIIHAISTPSVSILTDHTAVLVTRALKEMVKNVVISTNVNLTHATITRSVKINSDHTNAPVNWVTRNKGPFVSILMNAHLDLTIVISTLSVSTKMVHLAVNVLLATTVMETSVSITMSVQALTLVALMPIVKT